MNSILEFINTLKGQRLKQIARTGYAWPGGYQLTALMSDGGCLCRDCVRANYREIVTASKFPSYRSDGWAFEDCFIHWEGDSIYCDHCSVEITPEYSED